VNCSAWSLNSVLKSQSGGLNTGLMPLKGLKSWKKPGEHSAFRESGIVLTAVSLLCLIAESQLIDVIC